MSAAREALNWPHGDFAVHDPSPDDDHSAIYLICPGGLMVNTSGDPTPGLDAKRTAWMAENLNAALALPSPRSREEPDAWRPSKPLKMWEAGMDPNGEHVGEFTAKLVFANAEDCRSF